MTIDPKAPSRVRAQERYAAFEQDLLENGVTVDLAAQEQLNQPSTNARLLHPRFYLPTGVALGCPLPDQGLTRELSRIAELAAECCQAESAGTVEVFGFVPSEAYHVTVVSYSHYTTAGAEVIPFPVTLSCCMESVLSRADTGPITVDFVGPLITSRGGLIIRGLPRDEKLSSLRGRLVDEIPELAASVPDTAHIKLGHVLVSLDAGIATKILELLRQACPALPSVTFKDAFTPHGRVAVV